jgi:uncharacterized membrane protein YgdD (TMEM256/DUF423 family)
MAQAALLIGALYGALAVALGAFGAHALRSRLTPELQAVWKTAVEYHFYHALALLLVGIWARSLRTAGLDGAAWCFALGVLLFSGSLYVLALSGVRWLGAVTPLGGLLFLIGWALLAWTAARN